MIAEKPIQITIKEVNVSVQGYCVRLRGIENITIDSKKEE